MDTIQPFDCGAASLGHGIICTAEGIGHSLVVEQYAKEQQEVGPNLLFDGQ